MMAANLLLLVTIAVLIAVIFYLVFKREETTEKDIPGWHYSWILCNLFGLRYLWNKRHVMTIQEAALESFYGATKIFQKEGIFKLWIANILCIAVYDADLLEEFLPNGKHLKKASFYKFAHDLVKQGLLTSSNPLWKERRRLLTPAFHDRILEDDYLFKMDQHTKKFAEILSTKNEWFDIFPLMSLCTMDVIGTTSMNINLNCMENSHSMYAENIKTFGKIFMERIFNPLMAFNVIFKWTKSGKKWKKLIEQNENFTMQIIKERKEMYLQRKEKEGTRFENEYQLSTKKRKSFMDILLEEHFKNQRLSLEAIYEEVQTFIAAGHDSISVANSWTLYLLGRHPDIQRKVQEEIDSILGRNLDTPITPENLKFFTYTEMVIKESNRLCPPVPIVAREVSENCTLGKYTIPKGATLGIVTMALQRNPKYFPNPEKFDPDRFLPENSKKIHPYSYIPFSAGPRNCIGKRYAMMEQKISLINILRRCSVEARDHFSDLIMVPGIVLLSRSPPGLQIRCIPRNMEN